jgi:hypothetical protein
MEKPYVFGTFSENVAKNIEFSWFSCEPAQNTFQKHGKTLCF